MQSPFLKTAWMRISEQSIRVCPPALRTFLTEPDSLTLKLQASCPGTISLTLDEQNWRSPLLEECQLLGIKPDHFALVREIQLHSNGLPLLYARSVIPRKTYQQKLFKFRRLGREPLANLLFSDRDIFRQALEIAKITPQSMLAQSSTILTSTFASDMAASNELWGRRSIFDIANHPLLVTEVFLPGIDSCKS